MSSSATPCRRADLWISTRDKCTTRKHYDGPVWLLDPVRPASKGAVRHRPAHRTAALILGRRHLEVGLSRYVEHHKRTGRAGRSANDRPLIPIRQLPPSATLTPPGSEEPIVWGASSTSTDWWPELAGWGSRHPVVRVQVHDKGHVVRTMGQIGHRRSACLSSRPAPSAPSATCAITAFAGGDKSMPRSSGIALPLGDSLSTALRPPEFDIESVGRHARERPGAVS